ncbi:MAG: hypothetical protein A2539_07185 [Elusimicrobia bacterium RIFOXYD2_FULL_34_15]|nr:MAG: hypothetical protein A2539_07185 [Elusimicrobia bacterium RIFOXYD2_FULL_34_15]
MRNLQKIAIFYIISIIILLCIVIVPLKNKIANESGKSVALAVKYDDVDDLFGKRKLADFKNAGINTIIISDEKVKDYFLETGDEKYITLPQEKYIGISSEKISYIQSLNLNLVYFIQGNLSLLPQRTPDVLSVIMADDFYGEIPSNYNYTLGIIESFKQKETKKLLKKSDEGLRIFKLKWDSDTKKNIEKTKRAVLERNFKIIILDLSQTSLENALEYVKETKNAVENIGYNIGKSIAIKNINPSLSKFSFLTTIITLFISIISPVICIIFFRGKNKYLPNNIFTNISITFLLTIIFSIISGIVISGLLSTKDFMLGVDQFRGIKIALILPIIISFLLLYKENVKDLLNKNVLIGELIFLAVLLAVLGFYIMRSGNSGIMPSSEETFRIYLEKIFYVRPRIKEFLIGHPFMLLAIYLKNIKNISWKFFLLIGIIGQTSIINTFCHIHSPFYISLLRTFNGIWLGTLLGIILILLYKKLCLK